MSQSLKEVGYLSFDVKEAYRCGFMENKLEKLEVKNNTVMLPVYAFEIVTVMVK